LRILILEGARQLVAQLIQLRKEIFVNRFITAAEKPALLGLARRLRQRLRVIFERAADDGLTRKQIVKLFELFRVGIVRIVKLLTTRLSAVATSGL
jgi:hypothetical protein